MKTSFSGFAFAVSGVHTIIFAYDGYEKGRFMKSDEAIRRVAKSRCCWKERPVQER